MTDRHSELYFQRELGEGGDHTFQLTPQTLKQVFLQSLITTGQYKYARYGGLPLRYAGGKSLAVGHVIEHIPTDTTKLVSPFFCGGSVEIACARELGIKVQGYDLFDLLVNYWQVQITQPNELARRLEEWPTTDKFYREIKERLRQHWLNEYLIANKIELAAHYWFNHNLSYGPGFLGWMSKIYQNEARVTRLINKVRNFKAKGLSVSQGRFESIIPHHNGAFLYCDPSYYLDEDSKMFRGIYPQRNFPVHHHGFDHQKLVDLLKAHKGGFVLSYNDCSTIREWYADFDIHEVQWQYTLGQGETRIGKNRAVRGDNTHVKLSHELIITG